MNEVGPGKFGINAGMEDGLSSSLISLKDYNSNYGYIVVDLSRRYDYDANSRIYTITQINGLVVLYHLLKRYHSEPQYRSNGI